MPPSASLPVHVSVCCVPAGHVAGDAGLVTVTTGAWALTARLSSTVLPCTSAMDVAPSTHGMMSDRSACGESADGKGGVSCPTSP